jgi:predicted TIM-barrel fold metal-dependent hydrolase
MAPHEAYIGFPPLPDPETLVEALLCDPPEARWGMVRKLVRINDPKVRQDLRARILPHLDTTEDFRIRLRLQLALEALAHPCQGGGYAVVRGKGAVARPGQDPEVGQPSFKAQGNPSPALFPVVDFHVHPQSPDLTLLVDMHRAGVAQGVLLSLDTDPGDVERPEIRQELTKIFHQSPHTWQFSFDHFLGCLKDNLHPMTHVSNRDVADWIQDYPETFIGVGSVNPSKSRDYVKRTLEEIWRLGLNGIKLNPSAQFFNPADNENIEMLFQFCRETGFIVLTHCGCGSGPFETAEFCQNAHPCLWELILKKFPDVPLVLAHFGAYSTQIPGIWLHEVLQIGKRFRNVYADLAGVNWLLEYDMVVREIRKTIGFDRVLFATDYPRPVIRGTSLAYLVSSVKASTLLTEKEKWKILGKNACKLLQASGNRQCATLNSRRKRCRSS